MLVFFILLLILAAVFGVISVGATAVLLPILLLILAIGLIFSLINLLWHGIVIILIVVAALAIYDWLKKR